MQIYRDHILLYDSQFPYMEANPEYHVKGQFYEWESYKTINFQDGPALVFLTGMYTYQFFQLCAASRISFVISPVHRNHHGRHPQLHELYQDAER